MTGDLLIDLGTRIRVARHDAGFQNAESLAVRLRVGHRTVQRWEAGTSEPSLTRLREIAAVTGKPLTFFINSNGGDAA